MVERGFGGYPRNAQKLAEDAVKLVDSVIEFLSNDNDGDGFVDDLFIVHSGSVMRLLVITMMSCSHEWNSVMKLFLTEFNNYYSMEPEYWLNPGDMTCGVFAHEMGHAVFGLPDLYDTDYSSGGLGNWSLMAGGSWNGTLGNSPAFPDAWSHAQMGYLIPVIVSSNISGQAIIMLKTFQKHILLWKTYAEMNIF